METRYIIGLDIGGTKIRGILYGGKILRSQEIKTPQRKADFEKNLRNFIDALGHKANVSGVGIGSAGVIKGTILRFSPNIPTVKNFDFRKIVPAGVRLGVDNDARCFARAEYLLGAGRGFKNVFFLTIGTGIGRAVGRNGKILKIKKFEYPERWEKEYQRIRDKKSEKELAEFLGQHLSKLIKPHKPQAIIIGGGVALDRRNFVQKLQKEFQKQGLKSRVLKSCLGKHSATLGATLLFGK